MRLWRTTEHKKESKNCVLNRKDVALIFTTVGETSCVGPLREIQITGVCDLVH